MRAGKPSAAWWYVARATARPSLLRLRPSASARRAAYTVTRVPDWTDDLEVFCADIGSIARNKFAWARRLQAADDEEVHAPASIDSLAAKQAAARVLPHIGLPPASRAKDWVLGADASPPAARRSAGPSSSAGADLVRQLLQPSDEPGESGRL